MAARSSARKPAAKGTTAARDDAAAAAAVAATDPGAAEPAAGESLRDQRRREKDRVSRNHILDAAERVFGRKGFHEATLKEVADQAEFSVGALYAFFEGKDHLFAQVVERQGGALLASMEEAVAGAPTVPGQLHALAEASVRYFRDRPDFYRLFQRELGGATWAMRASLNEAGFARYREVMSFEERIFSAGIESGDLRDDDPEILAALFSGFVQAYLAQWVFSLDEHGHAAVEDAFPLERLYEYIDRAFLTS